jgi:hypothetical protein
MKNHLYNLLPIIYRQKDWESTEGQPLKSYLAILENVSDTLELDIDTLYNDWFIETCQDRIIPWIGELIDCGLSVNDDRFLPSYRSYVANTLAYRRRKGTTTILARAVQDLTGWEATVLEFFDHLSITQSLALQDIGEGGTISIRNVGGSEWIDSPFNALSARSVDIRSSTVKSNTNGMSECAPHIDPEAGIGLHSVGIYLARLKSYPIFQAMPHASKEHTGCYTFDPIGLNIPLFNLPATLRNITDMRQEVTMSLPLRRSVLETEWLERKKSKNWSGAGYFGDTPVFQIWIPDRQGNPRLLHSAEISIRDLTHWHHPEEGSGVEAFVDPDLGRFSLANSFEASNIRTSYNYGFSGDIGSGPYNHTHTIPLPSQGLWKASVTTSIQVSSPPFYASLSEAINAWQDSGQSGHIKILDSASYTVPQDALQLGSQLLYIDAIAGQRPCITGRLAVKGLSNGGAFYINGCLLKDPIEIDGNLRLSLQNCTLVPKHGRPSIQGTPITIPGLEDNSLFDVHGLVIQIQNSIVGSMHFASGEIHLDISDSIIDGVGSTAIHAYQDSDTSLSKMNSTIAASFQCCTVVGAIHITSLSSAQNSIFTEPLSVTRRNQGYLCFCFVPNGSTTPVRYRCQPDSALETAPNTADAHHDILLKLKPVFTSTLYGIPSYGQLGLNCPIEIRSGAENGSEMGAFHHLNSTLRTQGLQKALEEYLPYGLDAEVFCMT